LRADLSFYHPNRSVQGGCDDALEYRPFLWLAALILPLLVAVIMGTFWRGSGGDPDEDEVKGKRASGEVEAAVVQAPAAQPISAAPAVATGFAAQTRLGFTSGDQWEPAIAADRLGHVYILYPQYLGVPGCPKCYSPTMILQVSADRGATWAAPRVIYLAGSTTGQWDAQITVDPIDGQTVYASWLQNGKSDIMVGKSTDFGANWSVVTADSTHAGTDKPILLVRGRDVYVGYNHTQTVWVSSSHNAGATFTSVKVNSNGKLGWSLAGGGAIDPSGNVYFSWSGYEQNGGATWSAESDISTYVTGYEYIQPDGFSFPFGDYFEMDIDDRSTTHAIWGEGLNWDSPGSIWYTRGT
jgi:hypothetical protein